MPSNQSCPADEHWTLMYTEQNCPTIFKQPMHYKMEKEYFHIAYSICSELANQTQQNKAVMGSQLKITT